MNGTLQDSMLLPSCLHLEGRQNPRSAHEKAVLAVAVLDWAAVAVAVLAFVAAGVVIVDL